jgi:succinate dehydrogenase / fumarate reductase cytochrome b subunit
MAVSILHRATGAGMAVVAGMTFVWWLVAAASGPDAYALFFKVATSWFGYLVAFGLTWAFFQHLCNGLRHFVMDMGAGYELKTNKTGAWVVMAMPLLITALIWLPILLKLAKGAH